MSRRQGWWLALIVLVGLVVRLAAALRLEDSMIRLPTSDPDAYLQIANEWNRSGMIALDPGQPTSYRPPGYIALIRGTMMLAPEQLTLWVFGIHLVLSAVTILLSYVLAFRLGHGSIALLASALVAIDPILVRQSTLLMTETLYTALLVASLVGYVAFDGKRWVSTASVAVGLLTGLAALTRPISWPVWILLGLVSMGCQRWRGWIASTVMALLVCLPWGLRNQSELGRFIITTTHGGYTLWLGQNPVFYKEVVEGRRPTWEGESFERWVLENQTLTVGMTETERDDAFRRRAIEWMREHPGQAARSMLHHVGSLWRTWPHTGPEWMRPWIALHYGVLFLVAFLGILTRQAWRWPGLSLVAMVISFSVVHAVFWSDMRMRGPLAPAVACLATMGIVRWFDRRSTWG